MRRAVEPPRLRGELELAQVEVVRERAACEFSNGSGCAPWNGGPRLVAQTRLVAGHFRQHVQRGRLRRPRAR